MFDKEVGAHNTSLCDYMDCHYDCDYKPPKGKPIKDTYSIYQFEFEVPRAIILIRYLYEQEIAYSYNEIIDRLRYKYIEEEYIIEALDKMVRKKLLVRNPIGTAGHVEYMNDLYVFRPSSAHGLISIEARVAPGESADNTYIDITDSLAPTTEITKADVVKIISDAIKNDEHLNVYVSKLNAEM